MDKFEPAFETKIVNQVFDGESEKSKRTKFEILKAFMESVYLHGFENTSYETIASIMDTSKARVHYHFDKLSKVNLYAIQFIYIVGQNYTQKRMDSAKGWQEKLMGFAYGAVDWFENHPRHMSLLLLSYYQATLSEDYKELYDNTRQTGANRFFSVITDHIEVSEEEKVSCIRFIQRAVFGALIELSCSKNSNKIEIVKNELAEDLLCAMGRLVSRDFR